MSGIAEPSLMGVLVEDKARTPADGRRRATDRRERGACCCEPGESWMGDGPVSRGATTTSNC